MNLACAAFRESFEPGSTPPHRRQCAGCQTFASTVEAARAAGSRRDLPAALEQRLSALAGGERQVALHPDPREQLQPVPSLALPGSLERRLRRIGRERTPPHWLRSPAASLAASLLFTVMVSSLIENPSAGLKRLADGLERRFEAVAEPTLPSWQPYRLRRALAPAEATLRRTVEGARQTLTEWAERLEAALPETPPSTPPEN